jgi:phage tail tape-measure protein
LRHSRFLPDEEVDGGKGLELVEARRLSEHTTVRRKPRWSTKRLRRTVGGTQRPKLSVSSSWPTRTAARAGQSPRWGKRARPLQAAHHSELGVGRLQRLRSFASTCVGRQRTQAISIRALTCLEWLSFDRHACAQARRHADTQAC